MWPDLVADPTGHKYDHLRKISYYLELKLPPIEAKDLKENLGILLLCSPTIGVDFLGRDSFVDPTAEGTEPTFEKPIYFLIGVNNIFVDLIGIWVYHKKTGEIIAKDKVVPME